MFKRHKPKLPFFTALSGLSKTHISNFHALPIGNIDALDNSPYQDIYKQLLSDRCKYETTITGPFLDSLAYPSSVLAGSQKNAAKVFGSDQTLYVTNGSTMSNQIAVAACCGNSKRTIVQKGMHQSFHFALSSANVDPVYVEDTDVCSATGATALNLPVLLEELEEAERSGRPFEVVIVNSQSYEGVMHKLDVIFERIALAAPSLECIIVDEAWGAWSVFNKALSEHTGLSAARSINDKYDIDVVVTHSAHKSLFALRQSSLLHCIGSEQLQKRLCDKRYCLHTTSPSYTILSSLELSIDHAHNEGQMYAYSCERLASKLAESIQSKLKCFSLITQTVESSDDTPVVFDPTKIWISTRGINYSGEELRRILFNDFGIYTCRYSENALLISIHFGITEKDVEKLTDALIQVESDFLDSMDASVENQTISSEFIIPYPPGVPLVIPGDTMTHEVITKINQASAAGVPLLYIAR